MKKCSLVAVFILFSLLPLFPQDLPFHGNTEFLSIPKSVLLASGSSSSMETKKIFTVYTSFGGGPYFGIKLFYTGLQVGAGTDRFNFILDAGIGPGFFDDGDGSYYSYNLGGLTEFNFIKTFLLGLGGGIGGMIARNISYPYIQGAISFLFGSDFMFDYDWIKLGFYYNYCFYYGSEFGVKLCCSFIWD